MRSLPWLLVIFRILVAPFLLWDGWDGQVAAWFLWGYAAGVLSDIFDGVIARRLQVSTPQLRQADSWADVFFYGCAFASAWRVHPDAVLAFRVPLLCVVAMQAGLYGLNWAKFGKAPSYHTYTAKAWGIGLCIAIVALFGFGNWDWLWLAIALALLNSTEELVITLLLPTWQHDVLSIVHALRLR